MTSMLERARFIIGALMLVFAVAIALPVSAQQARNPDTSVNPTASSVKEDQLFQELNRITGRCTIPDQKACTIEQPAGRDWRVFHEVWLRWIGGVAIVVIFALLVIFYLWRGTLRLEHRSGRTMLRFTAFERFVHWMTATCFIILAITGLNITFGKPLLLPLIGASAFSAWSEAAKYAHNFLSFPFTIGVVLMFLMWVAQNLPTSVDVEWFKRAGGMLGGGEPPAYKFNGGEKLIFWIVVIGGGAAAATGYLLLFPFYGTGIVGMQTAQVVHSVVGVLYVAAMLVHIYMGTLGMEGAFEGMGTGEVDVDWAKQHHSLWLEEEMEKSRADAPSSRHAATPAE